MTTIQQDPITDPIPNLIITQSPDSNSTTSIPDLITLTQQLSIGLNNINNNNSNKYQIEDEWDINYDKPLSKDKDNANYCIGVYLATNKKDGTQVVLKIVSQDQRNRSFKIEIETLERLMKSKHENIIKTLGYKEGDCTVDGKLHEDCLFIFMEYLKGYKTILEKINKHHKFTEYQIRLVAHYLVFALAHLHSNSIIHRDIKGSNILIKIGSNGDDLDIKLIDFGFSKYYGNNKSNYLTFAGTPTHLAPEVFSQNNTASSRSDIWSLGCTLIEMAGGDLTKKVNGVAEIPSHLSNDLKNFIQHCLIVSPSERPKSIDLLNHKFINIEGLELSDLNKEILNSTIIQQVELTNEEFNTNNIVDSNIKHEILKEFNQDIESLQNKLPTTVTSLSLPVFNQPIKPNSIPSHIQSLSILSFNQDLEDEAIPSTITELVFGAAFQLNEHGSNLPDTIKKLTCSYTFNKSFPRNNNIPRKVSTLVLDNYNQPINGSIPSTVHTLTLGSNYQHFSSLSNLLTSVFNLTFGVSNECKKTNDEIKQLIPSHITNVTITRSDINNQ